MKYFVLTYKRPKLPTISTLLKCGIKREDIFIVHSTDDDSGHTFGNDIYFDKADYFDYDCFFQKIGERWKKSPTFARKFVIDYCKKNRIKYFAMLDDDYHYVTLKYSNRAIYPTLSDYVHELIVNCLDSDDRLGYICFSQNGDFVGGFDKKSTRSMQRKAMNWFYAKTENADYFLAATQDDVCMYLRQTKNNKYSITLPMVSLQQEPANKKESGIGMNEIYDNNFFNARYPAVMELPGAVTLASQKRSVGRIHHKIKFNAAYPKLILSNENI